MKQALAGVRVLEFTQVMAGPFCAMLLGDLGADVIKVEPPGGDTTRRMGKRQGMESAGYWAVNRNKRGVVLNLKDRRAQDIVRALARQTDVVVENYRPGVMAGFGLDYDSLKQEQPSLIYASVSGFGSTGPYAHKGGFDLVAQGMSGIMSVTGEAGRPPVKCGIPVTDLGAGLFAEQAILAAYIHRLKTGEGQYIDTSLLEAGVALSIWESTQYFSTGGIPEPMGSAHRMSAPYQAIRCADGYINLGAANTRTWEKFAQAIGRPELVGSVRIRGRWSARPKPSSTHARNRIRDHPAAALILARRARRGRRPVRADLKLRRGFCRPAYSSARHGTGNGASGWGDRTGVGSGRETVRNASPTGPSFSVVRGAYRRGFG